MNRLVAGERAAMAGIVLNKAADDSRIITFRASTTTKDRHGSRVKPDGLDTVNFEKNPIFVWGHDAYGGWFSTPQMENIIGRVESFTKTTEVFDISVRFPTADVNPKGDLAYKMTKDGMLNATSIGFMIKEILIENVDTAEETPIITKAELLEVSLVPIPSNPDALALVRSMALYGSDPFAPPDKSAEFGAFSLALKRAVQEHEDDVEMRYAFSRTIAEQVRAYSLPALTTK